MEISGSLGDLGTFIPLVVGLSVVAGMDFAAVLFWAGLFNIVTGFLFSIPMPVQPMKAIAAVAIAELLSPPQIAAAGILAGGIVFLLGVTGWITAMDRVVPRSLVRGIQLAIGLKLLLKGFGQLGGLPLWGWDSLSVGLLGLVAAFLLVGSRRLPAALLIFAAGLVVVWRVHPEALAQLHLSLYRPGLVTITASDWVTGFLRGTVPQVPLTLLNSVVAVCALSADLFPQRRARPREVAVSVGVMNLVGCWFGAMPMCHGAGGLAGQVRFGARTNGSILFLGSVKVLLALLFGATLLPVIRAYPASLLSVLLVVAGVELGAVARDQTRRADFVVVLVTAASSLAFGSTAVGFLAGLVTVVGARRGWFRLDG
jgi:MFS superfamily sulfate permease-like transporter